MTVNIEKKNYFSEITNISVSPVLYLFAKHCDIACCINKKSLLVSIQTNLKVMQKKEICYTVICYTRARPLLGGRYIGDRGWQNWKVVYLFPSPSLIVIVCSFVRFTFVLWLCTISLWMSDLSVKLKKSRYNIWWFLKRTFMILIAFNNFCMW